MNFEIVTKVNLWLVVRTPEPGIATAASKVDTWCPGKLKKSLEQPLMA